ncbi:hypothetical protein BLOT_003548 [Blomia tropicalis]|nr:hypothetical protein BLOT_003548 [Blomia tropicalis]
MNDGMKNVRIEQIMMVVALLTFIALRKKVMKERDKEYFYGRFEDEVDEQKEKTMVDDIDEHKHMVELRRRMMIMMIWR